MDGVGGGELQALLVIIRNEKVENQRKKKKKRVIEVEMKQEHHADGQVEREQKTVKRDG